MYIECPSIHDDLILKMNSNNRGKFIFTCSTKTNTYLRNKFCNNIQGLVEMSEKQNQPSFLDPSKDVTYY